MLMQYFDKMKFFSILALVAIGVLGRFFMVKFVGIPNFEIITAFALISGAFLGRIWGIVVPLSIISISDAVIGNNSVMFFTWSAFAVIGIFGWVFGRSDIKSAKFRIFGLAGVGIISSVFFFLYTNFGWWLVSGMYPHTLDGLIQCYIMGLPFFKNNLIGNLIFVPMAGVLAIFIKEKIRNKIWNSVKMMILEKK